MGKIILRKQYLDKLIDMIGTPDIKVVTGIRRSGKSTLIQEYIRYIRNNDQNSNIIFVNLLDIDYEELKEYHKLHSYIMSKYDEEKNNYLFIDEVQMCPKFELAVNSLHSKGIFDIVITGSNAFLLSSDLATLFTGRTMEVEVYPFSYSEFLDYYNLRNNEESFDRYVLEGGFPGSYNYKNETDRYGYISEVFNTIIIKDLIIKFDIKDELTLKNLSNYLMDNISNLTSPNSITEYISKNYTSVSHNTIGNYIKYLCNAFVFYEASRYDLKGKKYLATSQKYYLSDHSFRYALLGKKSMDYGRVYENIVYMELLREGYDVYIGKLYQKEIDFVATKQNEKIYIQVSDNISDENTFKREYEPLLKIKDAYPKMIIANTKHEDYFYEGIKIVDLKDWLVNH